MALPLPAKVTDLRGRTFGRLTVREFAEVKNGFAYWKCDCECGTVGKEVRGKNLAAWEKEGRAISCGCLRANPLIRKAARLTMTEEDRRAAAGGQRVTPERPAPVPRPKAKRSHLPFVGDRPRAIVDPGCGPIEDEHSSVPSSASQILPRPTPSAPAEPMPSAAHTVFVVITKDRHEGYHVAVRLHQRSNTPLMQSRRLRSPSEARNEAKQIWGPLHWVAGRDAGLHNQPWVVEIAEVQICPVKS